MRTRLLLAALSVAVLAGGCTASRPPTAPLNTTRHALGTSPSAASQPLQLAAFPDLPGLPPAVTEQTTASPGASDIIVAYGRVWALVSGRLDVYDLHLRPLGRIPVGNQGEAASWHQVLGAARGSVWVGFDSSDTLHRIDAYTHRVTGIIPYVQNPSRMIAVGNLLWVAEYRTGNLTAVDMNTNEKVGAISLNSSTPGAAGNWADLRHNEREADPIRLAATSNLIWVEEYVHSQIVAVDPTNGRVLARRDCSGLSADAGTVTATCTGAVVWFDPATAAVRRRIRAPEWLGVGPLNILAPDNAGGWITAPQHNGVVRVDAALRPVAATAITPRLSPTRITVVGDALIGLAANTPFSLNLT
jgi:hypothetical protein